ncbi:hypothetical protein B7P43_G14709 [Cryptotermes secundus]|uniref:Protein bric-a-brac 2 n=1 Tax=Cryptotermes secundus TaxID=105785 RepID=A0A2J7QKA4_9NEOP|nr:hypothetical protein B7P43_G14709 [Cryptotermes secundus]
MGSEHYCLRWNNHQSNLLGVFSQLLQDESLVDVTLACAEGHSIRAHKVVLSACSSYFQTLFVDHPNRHPIVILKDVRFAELRTLVEFMYKGEVNVEYCQLSALLKTAESLKVKGLAEMTNLNSAREDRSEGHQQQQQQQPKHSSINVPDTPVTPEVAGTTRLINEDTDTPPPGGSLSPPPSKRATQVRRDSGCNDNESCDEGGGGRVETPGVNDLSSVHGGCVGPSDMSVTTNATSCNPPATAVTATCSTATSRLPSPHSNEPMPGPSGLVPVQQVPLSLKKEVDWDRSVGDDRSTTGESSSDYRHPHEPESLGVSEPPESHSPRLFACMYCGASFPYQSKLTRHILSHSLETLKYREQVHLHQQQSLASMATAGIPAEPLNLMETHFGSRQDLPEPSPHENSAMELDLAAATAVGLGEVGTSSNVVLCKFCGKSFPDVGSLIAHLPVHTGDRPFKCEFCGKAFKLRHHMKDHCRVHTGERPFRCALCGKTFSRSTILKAHEKTHYPKYVRKFLSPSPVDTEEESPQQ